MHQRLCLFYVLLNFPDGLWSRAPLEAVTSPHLQLSLDSVSCGGRAEDKLRIGVEKNGEHKSEESS